jgi:hypothetical protein
MSMYTFDSYQFEDENGFPFIYESDGETYATLQALRQVPSIEEQHEAMDQMYYLGDHVTSCLTCKQEIDPHYDYCGCTPEEEA